VETFQRSFPQDPGKFCTPFCKANLACKTKRKFKATTDSRHNLPVAENHLNRQFSTEKPNQVYVGDITYISTQEGWLYLAVVIDLYSRQVVGWSMAERKPVHRLTLKRS
jgi:transposase InsO family protein